MMLQFAGIIATLFVVVNIAQGAVDLKISPMYSTLYVVPPERLNITCSAKGTEQEVKGANWMKDGVDPKTLAFNVSQKMESVGATSNMVIKIDKSASEMSDSGKYTCSTFDKNMERSIDVKTLDVATVEATFDRKKETASLVCTLKTEVTPTPTMTWERNGMELSGSKYEVVSSNNTLIIKDTERKDAGEYFCVFDFLENNQVIRVPVNYYAAPLVVKFEKSKNLIQGETLTLKCDVVSHPMAKVTWYFNERTLEEVNKDREDGKEEGSQMKTLNSESGIIDGVLQIQSLDFADKGNYMCIAHSSYFNLSANSTLVIRVKDKLAALWPFLGIVAEVIVLCVIIFIYEKKRSKPEEDDNDVDAGNSANAADHKAKEEVRQRNVRT